MPLSRVAVASVVRWRRVLSLDRLAKRSVAHPRDHGGRHQQRNPRNGKDGIVEDGGGEDDGKADDQEAGQPHPSAFLGS